MSNGWTETRVRAVLSQYLEIAEVLHDPGVASGLGEQATRRTDETLPYLCGLAIEKADIEQAVLYLPWPRLVPAALYWLGGFTCGEIGRLEGRSREAVGRAVRQAEEDVIAWLVRGRWPDPPRFDQLRYRGWSLSPFVVALLCDGCFDHQALARWLVDWALRKKFRTQVPLGVHRSTYTIRSVANGAAPLAGDTPAGTRGAA